MIDASVDRTIVELHPHDPSWTSVATNESQRMSEALGDILVRIEHVGSTAIPGISAKPTVDLMPIVRGLSALDSRSGALRALGYEWKGEFGIAGRRYCTVTHPETGKRLFNVHIFERGFVEIDRHVAFRDYLRAHPDQARAYEGEKRRAAAAHPNDTLAYNDAKGPWIKDCEPRALAWWRARS